MAKSVITAAQVSGIVTVVPSLEIQIDQEVDLYGGNQKQLDRIKRVIGLDRRRITDTNTTSLDLCFQATKLLLQGLGRSGNEIDGLICVTQTPDHFQPCNAAILHGRLGLSKNCACFDVNLGCSGYVYGLWLAHMMVGSGGCSNVILLAGDTMSKCVNPRDRSTYPLFGDAGSATLIERSSDKREASFCLHTDGDGEEFLKIPAGGFRQKSNEQTGIPVEDSEGNWRSQNDIFMDGGEVFNFSIRTEPAAISELLRFSGVEVDGIDFFVFHQANRYIISNIARRLKLPMEKVPCDTVAKYGNQSSASIPSTICDSLREKVSSSSQSLVLSGFGVGLSWASALISMDRIYCPPVAEYCSRGSVGS